MKFNIPGARNYSRGIKLLLISLIILLGITIYETTRVIRSGRRITETQDVMKYSKKVLTHALDNESRFRGYILTGQKNFLGPQEKLQKEIYNGLGRLEKFTHEHPEQKARADSMFTFINERIIFSNKAISDYDAGGADAVKKMVEISEGRLYTDRIRLLVDKLQDRGNTLLRQYRDANNSSVISLQRMLIFVIAGIVLLLIAFTRKVRADNIEKGKTAEALKKMNDELEIRVMERTLEIRSAIERYDILSQATHDTIWDWDIVHNKMLYNDGITKTFGYQANEVSNVVDWWNEKLHPDDFKKVTEMVEEVFEKSLETFQLTYRFRCADGSYKYVFDRAYVMFDENNNPCRMIGAMQDISSQVEEDLRMAKAIIDTQEKERQYIGAELHDNVNQILASALLVMSMIKNEKMTKKETLEFIETGRGYVNDAIEELRKLSHELAPASFDKVTLGNAFEDLLHDFNLDKRFKIKFKFDEMCNMVSDDIQINLYRITQEQLKNIVKYAEAKRIEVVVTRTNGTISLRIFDNGIGFDVKTAKNGIGLSNIKKRADSLAGKFILNSSPGKGCEMIVEIPVNEVSLSKTG
jgi:two-component system sensor histidine kinase UhpB